MTAERNVISSKSVPVETTWKTILECAAVEVFEMMAGVRPTVTPALPESFRGAKTAMVGMAGALCGITTISCSSELAAKLASLMLGDSSDSNSSAASDALGELCNMVAGNFKAKISGLADHCMLSVPTVITGEDYSMEPQEPSETITANVMLEGNPISISLIVHS